MVLITYQTIFFLPYHQRDLMLSLPVCKGSLAHPSVRLLLYHSSIIQIEYDSSIILCPKNAAGVRK